MFSSQCERIEMNLLIHNTWKDLFESGNPRARLCVLLPRDADRIMSGNCGVVAIWVTHPLWPFSVPLTVICSVILATIIITLQVDGAGLYRRAESSPLLSAYGNRKRTHHSGSRNFERVLLRVFPGVKCSACIAICCPIVGKTGFKINLNPFIFDLVNMVIYFVG